MQTEALRALFPAMCRPVWSCTQTLCEVAHEDLEWYNFHTKNTKGLWPWPEIVKVFLAWCQTAVTLPSQDTWLIQNPDPKSHWLDYAMEGFSWRIQTSFANLSHILAPGRFIHPIPIFSSIYIAWLVKILVPHVQRETSLLVPNLTSLSPVHTGHSRAPHCVCLVVYFPFLCLSHFITLQNTSHLRAFHPTYHSKVSCLWKNNFTYEHSCRHLINVS